MKRRTFLQRSFVLAASGLFVPHIVRAQQSLSDPAFVASLNIPTSGPSAPIFSDNFNRADSSTVGGPWTSEVDASGVLGISSDALQYYDAASPQASAYVVYTHTETGETWMQFTFNLDLLDIASGGSRSLLEVRTAAGANIFTFKLFDCAAVSETTCYSFATFDDAASITEHAVNPPLVAGVTYTVKIRYKCATSAGANDGIFEGYIDGVRKTNITNGDTDTLQIGSIRLGQMSTSAFTTAATLRMDDFVWRYDDNF